MSPGCPPEVSISTIAPREFGILPDALSQLEAVHLGHVPVDQNQLVGVVSRGCRLQGRQRKHGTLDRIGLHSPLRGDGMQNFAIGEVVVHDQAGDAFAAKRERAVAG